jgi:hypothetical protein
MFLSGRRCHIRIQSIQSTNLFPKKFGVGEEIVGQGEHREEWKTRLEDSSKWPIGLGGPNPSIELQEELVCRSRLRGFLHELHIMLKPFLHIFLRGSNGHRGMIETWRVQCEFSQTYDVRLLSYEGYNQRITTFSWKFIYAKSFLFFYIFLYFYFGLFFCFLARSFTYLPHTSPRTPSISG